MLSMPIPSWITLSMTEMGPAGTPIIDNESAFVSVLERLERANRMSAQVGPGIRTDLEHLHRKKKAIRVCLSNSPSETKSWTVIYVSYLKLVIHCPGSDLASFH